MLQRQGTYAQRLETGHGFTLEVGRGGVVLPQDDFEPVEPVTVHAQVLADAFCGLAHNGFIPYRRRRVLACVRVCVRGYCSGGRFYISFF